MKGVKKYGHEARDDSGKFHPDGVSGSGPNVVSKDGGSHQDHGKAATASTSKVPRGVVVGDGTEHLGVTPKGKRGSRALPKVSVDTSKRPSGVSVYNGLKAPKSAR